MPYAPASASGRSPNAGPAAVSRSTTEGSIVSAASTPTRSDDRSIPPGSASAARSAAPHADEGPDVIEAPSRVMARNHSAGSPAKRSVVITCPSIPCTAGRTRYPNSP